MPRQILALLNPSELGLLPILNSAVFHSLLPFPILDQERSNISKHWRSPSFLLALLNFYNDMLIMRKNQASERLGGGGVNPHGISVLIGQTNARERSCPMICTSFRSCQTLIPLWPVAELDGHLDMTAKHSNEAHLERPLIGRIGDRSPPSRPSSAPSPILKLRYLTLSLNCRRDLATAATRGG
jgi:hypothetical protein